MTADGDVSQTAAAEVSGATAVTVADGSKVDLDNADNEFASVGVVGKTDGTGAAGEVTIVDSDGTLKLDAIRAAKLTVTADGDVSQTAAADIAGETTVTAEGHSVTLDNADNDFNSVTANGATVTLNDADDVTLTQVKATAGDVDVTADGQITATDVDASGNATLTATADGIEVTSVKAGNGTASLTADDAVKVAGSVTAGKDALIDAKGGDVTVDGSVKAENGDVLARAEKGDVTVNGTVAAKNGATVLKADKGDATVASGAAVTTKDFGAEAGKSVKADGKIEVARNAAVKAKDDIVITDVGSSINLAAESTGGDVKIDVAGKVNVLGATTVSAGGVSVGADGLKAADEVAVAASGISGAKVSANGNADLTVTQGGDYTVKETKASGNLTLDVGGKTDVDTIEAGKKLELDTGSTLAAKDKIKAGADAEIKAGGKADVKAFDVHGKLQSQTGDLKFDTMAAGSADVTAGNIDMGKVTATDATFDARGSIRDNGSEVATKSLTMKASGDIGAPSAPIVTKTQGGTLKDVSGRNVYVKETAAGTVGVGRIAASGDLELSAPNLGENGRLVPAGGGVNIQSGGDMTLDVAGHIGQISADGSGHIELDVGGKLDLKSGSLSGHGSKGEGLAVVDKEGYVYVVANAPADKVYSIWNGYTGANGQKVPGLVIINGQVLDGNPDITRKIHRAEAFTVETPELKSKQGVFGSPVFVHTDMDVSEAASIGSVDYLRLDTLRFQPVVDDAVNTTLLEDWLYGNGDYVLSSFESGLSEVTKHDEIYTRTAKPETDEEKAKKAEEKAQREAAKAEAAKTKAEKAEARKQAKLAEKAAKAKQKEEAAKAKAEAKAEAEAEAKAKAEAAAKAKADKAAK